MKVLRESWKCRKKKCGKSLWGIAFVIHEKSSLSSTYSFEIFRHSFVTKASKTCKQLYQSYPVMLWPCSDSMKNDYIEVYVSLRCSYFSLSHARPQHVYQLFVNTYFIIFYRTVLVCFPWILMKKRRVEVNNNRKHTHGFGRCLPR